MPLTSSRNFLDHQTNVILNMDKWKFSSNCDTSHLDFLYDTEESVMRKCAVSLCYDCPVQNHCLYTAVVINEYYGVWGGLTPRQRRSLIKNLKSLARLNGLNFNHWNEDLSNFIFKNTNLKTAIDIISF